MATYDLNAAKTKLSDYTRQKWNRDLSEGDFGAIGQKVGYAGGTIDDDLLNRSYSALDEYAADRAWGGSSMGSPPEVPWTTGGPGVVDNPTHLATGAVAPSTGSVPPSGGGSAPPPSGTGTPTDLANILGPGNQLNSSQQAAQEALMRLLTGAQQAATISDPDLQPTADAYRMRRQRGYERERNALAERGAATGAGSRAGGFNAQAIGALQGANRDTAMFEAGLVKDKADAQRQQLMQAIELAQQAGNTQAAQEAQRRLALLDATLRQQQINLGQSLGQQDVDLRRLLGFGGLDLNRELGRGDLDLRNRTLSQQGALGRGDLSLRLLQSLMNQDQFYSGLGLSAAQLQALLNQNAVSQLLNGF